MPCFFWKVFYFRNFLHRHIFSTVGTYRIQSVQSVDVAILEHSMYSLQCSPKPKFNS